MIDAGIKAACNSKGIEMVLNQKIVVENEHFKGEIESLSYTGIDEYKAMIAVAEGE
jgi:NADH/NAD ratio-sensing transcriptional regulator Rex